ncbi:MAG: glycosyltransferase family 2 protein [Actinobacteria bacterium]|nr:glycosyltransferase family 2 protein [Actinomycetota bacterium]
MNPTQEKESRGRPRVTFIVPTRNSQRTLGSCLRSIREQTNDQVEIIVVDNSSSDATVRIAAHFSDIVKTAGPERSAQRNAGAWAASGDYLAFIDSDMVLSGDIAEEIVQEFESNPDVGSLVIPEVVTTGGFWQRCRALEKSGYMGDEAVEAARVFRKDTFAAIGGYNEELTAGEDWELSDRIKSAGGRVGRVRSYVNHDESGLTLRAAFKKKKYYGASFRHFLSQSEQSNRRRLFRRSLLRPFRLFRRDPFHVAGLYVLKSVELMGLLAGVIASSRRKAISFKSKPPPSQFGGPQLPSLDIGIPAYNEGKSILFTLESLSAALSEMGLHSRIILSVSSDSE